MEKEGLKKKVIKNSFWNFGATLANRLGGLVFTIILARFLLPEGFGTYSIVLAVSMIFFTFADLGVNGALVRYVSSALAKNKEKVSAYYRYLLKLKFLFVLTASILLLILAYPISFYLYKNPALFLPLIIAALYILTLSFENFYTQIFYAVEKVKFSSIKETIHQIIRIVLVFFVFYFVVSSYQVMGVFVTLTITSIILLILVIVYSRKLIPELYKKPTQKINKKRVRRFLGFLTIASISAIFFSYIDSIMLGIFVATKYVGYYRASFSLVFGIAGLLAFSNIIFLPVFTKLRKNKINKVLNLAFKHLSYLSIPAIFGLLVLGKYFVKLLYGNNYLPSVISLSILTFLIFFTVSIGLFLSLFSAKEKPEIFAKLIIVTTILNIVLNFVLIKSFLTISPLWATAGAALATILSWIFYFIAAVYFIKKDLNLKIDLKPLIKPLASSLIMFLVLFIIVKQIDMNILTGIGTIVLGFVIYTSLMLFFDKNLRKELREFKNLFALKKE